MLLSRENVVEAVEHLRTIEPQSVHSDTLLRSLIEFIRKHEVSKIDLPFIKDIMDRVPEYANTILHYFKDLSSSQAMEVAEIILQTIGSLEVKIVMKIKKDDTQCIERYGDEKTGLIQMNDYLCCFFEDPFLVVESLTDVEVKFTTDMNHALRPFITGKYHKAIGEFTCNEIERYDYPFNLLANNSIRRIKRYAYTNLKTRIMNKYKKQVMAFGIGENVSEHVYQSMDISLLDYYTVCDVLLHYLRSDPNNEDITKEAFYSEFELSKDIIKMIDAFLERFDSTPYTWLYSHILALGDKGKLKYLKELNFEDDINETVINHEDGRKIPLFTVKSGVRFDTLFNILNKKRMNDDNKQWWYYGTSRGSADRILVNGIQTRYIEPGGHDFGIRSAFYLGEDLRLTIERALKKYDPNVNDFASVLIYKTDSIDRMKDMLKPGLNEHWNVWDLSDNDEDWQLYVNLSRKSDRRMLEKHFPRADDHRLTDLIYGPIATNLKRIDHEGCMQLALKSNDSHDIFESKFLEAVIVFQEKIS